MPYFVQLPVIEIQDWNAHPVLRDVKRRVFQEWCSYFARSICSVHSNSELCIGYLLVDIPATVKHGTGKGVWPNLEGLSEEEREEKIGEMSEGYYSTICTGCEGPWIFII